MTDIDQVRNQLLSDWAEIILLKIDEEISNHFDEELLMRTNKLFPI